MSQKRSYVAIVTTLALVAGALPRPADAQPLDRVAETAPPLAKHTEEAAEASVPDHLTVTRFENGESFTGSTDRFTGHVLVESLFAAYPPGRAGGAMVHFEAGARTAWHTHPLGQVLVVSSGVGWVQSEGQQRITVHPGDVVRIPPGIRHWHGATSDQPMSHLAVLETLDGISTHWMELVPDETYLDATDVEASAGE